MWCWARLVELNSELFNAKTYWYSDNSSFYCMLWLSDKESVLLCKVSNKIWLQSCLVVSCRRQCVNRCVQCFNNHMHGIFLLYWCIIFWTQILNLCYNFQCMQQLPMGTSNGILQWNVVQSPVLCFHNVITVLLQYHKFSICLCDVFGMLL